MAEKKVYNRATGEHQAPAPRLSAKEWWLLKMGFGNKQGEGALAKRRKKSLDENIKEGGG